MLEDSFSDVAILKSEIFYSRPSKVHVQKRIWFVVIISKWFVHITRDSCHHLLVDERQKNSILKFEPYAQEESNEATGEFAYM